MKVLFRVKSQTEFSEVYKKGHLIKNNYYVAHIVNPNGKEYARIGVAASNKLGNAVVRNKAKRQFRAIADSIIDYKKYNFDLVVILKTNFVNETYEVKKSAFKELVKEYL